MGIDNFLKPLAVTEMQFARIGIFIILGAALLGFGIYAIILGIRRHKLQGKFLPEIEKELELEAALRDQQQNFDIKPQDLASVIVYDDDTAPYITPTSQNLALDALGNPIEVALPSLQMGEDEFAPMGDLPPIE